MSAALNKHVSLALERVPLVLQMARVINRYGPELILRLSRGLPPYAIPSATARDVNRALRLLGFNGLVARVGRRGWRVADPFPRDALQSRPLGWSGGLFVEKHTILRINGRDQTKLIAGVEKQISCIGAALAKLAPYGDVDIYGALCFPVVDGLPMFRRIEIRSVLVDGPKRVAKLAARPGPLDAAEIERIWAHLARAFPAA